MSFLDELEEWVDGIYQLTREDVIDAGAAGDGVANLQPKQLANRARYLLARVFGRDIAVNVAASPYTLSTDAWARHLIQIAASIPGATVLVPEPELGEARTKVFRNTSANDIVITTPLAVAGYTLPAGAKVMLTLQRIDADTTEIVVPAAELPADIVTEAGSQTLTNKVISGAANTISNLAASAITSGQLALARGGFGADISGAAGIGKLASGVWTWLAAPSTDIVGKDDSQTLTNKVISGAANTISNVAASAITSGQLALARGGFGADISGAAGIPKLAAGVWSWVTAPASGFVGLTENQVLQNKACSPPTGQALVWQENDASLAWRRSQVYFVNIAAGSPGAQIPGWTPSGSSCSLLVIEICARAGAPSVTGVASFVLFATVERDSVGTVTLKSQSVAYSYTSIAGLVADVQDLANGNPGGDIRIRLQGAAIEQAFARVRICQT